MTGRRLYDKYCDSTDKITRRWRGDEDIKQRARDRGFVAWPFLTTEERRIWNETARRITPTSKPKAAA